jgi:alpha-tubulin suppressor-like RCC1 family protein
MPTPSWLTNIVSLSVGHDHDIMLRGNGSVIVWGWNGYGQTNIPANLTNVLAVSAGGDDNVVLDAAGNLVSWGRNNWGQTDVPRGLTNIVAIASGLSHNFALSSDGLVTGWGWNQFGQTNVPPGLSNVMAIAGGFSASLALVADGPPFSFAATGSPKLDDVGFSVAVPTVRGRKYRFEFKSSLADATWSSVAPLAGDGTVGRLMDLTAEGPARFYRVRQW